MNASADICVMGGGGHVGLPLSLVFASKGKKVRIFDINRQTIDAVLSGQMPFMEKGAEPLLKDVLSKGMLDADMKPECIRGVPVVIITIGTPVDEFLNPSLKAIHRCFGEIAPFLSDDQLIVMRSTVYPGVTESMARAVNEPVAAAAGDELLALVRGILDDARDWNWFVPET